MNKQQSVDYQLYVNTTVICNDIKVKLVSLSETVVATGLAFDHGNTGCSSCIQYCTDSAYRYHLTRPCMCMYLRAQPHKVQ